jgi:hypothetical protein
MFARVEDVKGYYPQAQPVQIAYYRRKDLD